MFTGLGGGRSRLSSREGSADHGCVTGVRRNAYTVAAAKNAHAVAAAENAYVVAVAESRTNGDRQHPILHVGAEVTYDVFEETAAFEQLFERFRNESARDWPR